MKIHMETAEADEELWKAPGWDYEILIVEVKSCYDYKPWSLPVQKSRCCSLLGKTFGRELKVCLKCTFPKTAYILGT